MGLSQKLSFLDQIGPGSDGKKGGAAHRQIRFI